MALQGKIIVLENRQFGFEYITTLDDKPEQMRQVWPIAGLRTSGIYCSAEDVVGKPASVADGRVTCYLGNGNHAAGVLPDGGSTKSISLEVSPVARPKCRSKLRWRNGRWEKYSRKGWVIA